MARRATPRAGSRPSWLPRPARRRPLPSDPWCPSSLEPADVEDEAIRYVMLEEVVGDSVGLLVAAWPRAGADGLPVFADPEEDLEVGADRQELQRRVDRLRRPVPGMPRAGQAELRRRPLALGDVFAAPVDPAALDAAAKAAVTDSGWLSGPLLDVTADARNAAKQAFYHAVTPPLAEAAREEIIDEQIRRS